MTKKLTVQDLFNGYYITDTSIATQITSGDIEIDNGKPAFNPDQMLFKANPNITIVTPDMDIAKMAATVTDMSATFNDCSQLTYVNLPELSYMNNMGGQWGSRGCFSGCYSLKEVTLQGLPNVTNMGGCFYDCQALTSISLPSLPNVRNMVDCFEGCISLQDLTIGNIGSSISTTGYNRPLSVSHCTRLTYDSLMNLINALPTKSGQYLELGTTNLNKLTDDEKAIATNKGWSLS